MYRTDQACSRRVDHCLILSVSMPWRGAGFWLERREHGTQKPGTQTIQFSLEGPRALAGLTNYLTITTDRFGFAKCFSRHSVTCSTVKLSSRCARSEIRANDSQLISTCNPNRGSVKIVPQRRIRNGFRIQNKGQLHFSLSR